MQPSGPSGSGRDPQPGDEPQFGDESLSVLLIERNSGDARLFEEYLEEYATERGVEVTLRHEKTLQAGLQALGTSRPDVLAIGLGLPDSEGLEAVKAAVSAAPEVPLVVLTGGEDPRQALQAQKAGASEYLRKEELTPALLGRTLQWALQRSQMEARLRQRDAWIRSITESVAGGVFRLGPTGQIEYANEALAELLGFANEDRLLGKDLTGFYAKPSERGTLLATEGAENEEVEFERRDGSTFTCLLSAQVARREDGTPIHFDGIITDITERKQAEQELQKSRERLATAQRIAGLGSWERRFDEDGQLFWSEETRRIFGWDPGKKVTYETFMEAVYPEDREALRSQQQRALEEGTPIDIEYRIRRSNGEVRVLQEQGEVELADDGSPVRMSGTVLDITERKKREKRLEVLSEAVQQAKEAVLITEAEAIDEPGPRIVYVNEAFEEMTGYREEEVVGKTPRILQGPETDRAVLDEVREALEAGEEWEGETVNYRKNETPYIIQWNLSPVVGEDGEIKYWVSVQRDVTEEREREETLRRQRNLLDQTQKLAGAWEADLQTGKMSWSTEVYRIHEVPPGTQITTDEGIEFYAPEARPKIRDAFQRCIEEGEPYDLELPLITAEGNRRWVRTVGAPSDRKNGEVVKVAGAFQDITDRKKAERELVESEERYRTLAEHFPNGAVGVYDHDLRYSLAEGELLGTRLPTSDDLEGDQMPDIFPESTASDLEPMFRAAVEEGVSGRRETTFDGRVWRVWATPLRGPEGEIFAGLSYAQDITEHKQREQALREQRNLLNQTQRLAGGWQVDLESGRVSWSEEVYRIHELPPDTEIGLDEAIAFFEAGAADELEEAFDRCIEDGEPYDLELPLTTAKGNRRWVRTVGAPSEQKNGETVKVAGALQDITDRKEAERDLREREVQLRGLANSIPGVVFQAYARPGREYGFHIVSEGAEELLGISAHPDDFFERCLEQVPDSEREQLLEAIDDTVDAGEQLQFESPFVKPSGETIWILGTATPERRENELVYNGVILDITERKNAERTLQEREEYLSVTLQSIGDAVVATDRDGSITEMNAVAEQLTGWSKEEAKGKLLDDILTLHSARTGETVESPADEVLREGRTVGLANHTVLTARDGTEYQIADSAAPIQADDGDLRGVVLVFRDVTEKYERRRRMERQNDLFSKAEDLADVGGWEYDVRSGKAIWTEKVYRIHGLSPDVDASPEQSLQFYHEEDRPVIEEAFAQAVEEGASYDLELRLITADGNERWVRTRGEPQIQDGTVVRVRGTIQDITERKSREKELERATGLLRRAGEMADLGGWSVDVLGERPYSAEWTDTLYDLFELPRDVEPPTEDIFEYYHPDDRERHRRAVIRAEEEGADWDQELRLVTAKGTERWVRNIGRAITEDGETVEIRGTIQDITERKERRERLRLLAEALEQVGDKVVITDSDGRIEFVNEAFERITGYAEDDARGKTPDVLKSDQHDDAFYTELWDTITVGDTFRAEIVNERKDGTTYVEDETISPVVDEDGDVTHFVCTGRDVTDRKEREQALKAAKEEAERMNQLKSAFLANMSHEIRTPLTSILGFAEVIGDEVDALTQGNDGLDLSVLRRYSDLIQKGGRRLMETLEDVLNLSKLEAGEMDLSSEPTDVVEAVTEILEQFEPQAQEAGVAPQVDVPEEAVQSHVDPEGLRIALRNLVNNAIKYTEEGGQVWVRVRPTEDTVLVEVEDTGIGMEPEQVPELFEAFVQESDGIRREYEGSGLGLTITRKVVNQMGGTVHVETEKGEGSRFVVRLPPAETPPAERG